MEEGQVRVMKPRPGEVLGVVEALMGANRLKVRCQDDKIRLCRIPGRLRKRMWMREGDIVLVRPWEIKADTSGDIVTRYTPTQAGWLRRKGIFKMNL